MMSLIKTMVLSSGLLGVIAFASAASQLHASDQPVRQFSHAQGKVQLPQVPTRVVVLDLASLENCHALGIPVVGVPTTNADMLPDYLAKYAGDEFQKVGSLFEPEWDTIGAIKPDLIIVGGRSSRHCQKLNDIAPTIDLSTTTSGFVPSVVQNLLTLGAIFNKEVDANQLALELLSRVRDLQAAAKEQGTGLLVFSVGERVMPQQPATRFGIVYELIGISPAVIDDDFPVTTGRRGRGEPEGELTDAEKAAQEAKQRAEEIAAQERFAKIMGREPNWIFAIDRNSAFGERADSREVLASVPVIQQSKAWENDRVVYLSGTGWYLIGGGVVQLNRTIDQILSTFEAE